MKLEPHLPLLLLPLLTSAPSPSRWSSFANPTTILNASRMRDRAQSILVSGGNDTPHIADIIGTCKNEQGGIVPKSECQFSVLATGMGMGLAVVGFARFVLCDFELREEFVVGLDLKLQNSNKNVGSVLGRADERM
ncbi:hypothetical protein BKA65DRAFT_487684 [Rhexocercosporidium sp. MPI-PUGE-AT-0058]|nr:hypothetical protein BKA65DRAFT_487684 [Rhexocercosporidium sp. MPI-PUGE-AT-0058]